MEYFFSNSTKGFYPADVELPEDAQPLTGEEYRALMDGQAVGVIDWSGPRPTITSLPAPTVASVQEVRRKVYRLEADPLKMEAEYDAISSETEPDYSFWLAKVAEIKERYPLPEEPAPRTEGLGA